MNKRSEEEYNQLIIEMENRGWEYVPKSKAGKGIAWRSTHGKRRTMYFAHWGAVEKFIADTPELEEDEGETIAKGIDTIQLENAMRQHGWICPRVAPSGKVYFADANGQGKGSARTLRFDNWEAVRDFLKHCRPEPPPPPNYSVHKMLGDILGLVADYPTPVYVKVGRDGAFLPLEHMMCDYIGGKRSLVLIARGTMGGAA